MRCHFRHVINTISTLGKMEFWFTLLWNRKLVMRAVKMVQGFQIGF